MKKVTSRTYSFIRLSHHISLCEVFTIAGESKPRRRDITISREGAKILKEEIDRLLSTPCVHDWHPSVKIVGQCINCGDYEE